MLYNNFYGNKSMFNLQSLPDIRNVMSGKDAMIYSLDGTALASTEQFQAQIAVTNQNYMPLGDAQEHGVFTSYKVTLTMTEVLITDALFIQELLDGMRGGEMPFFNIQGQLRGRSGKWQKLNYRQCVPDGNIDLQNFNVGDIVKRAWSFIVNEPPEAQSLLLAD